MNMLNLLVRASCSSTHRSNTSRTLFRMNELLGEVHFILHWFEFQR